MHRCPTIAWMFAAAAFSLPCVALAEATSATYQGERGPGQRY